MRIRSLLSALTIGLFLAGCSPDIPLTPAASPTPTSAPATPTAIPATPPAVAPAQVGDPSLPISSVPVTWGDLNLAGRLVYISATQIGDAPLMRIQALDLATGGIATIFQADDGAWIYFVDVSPDERQLVMSMSPSPAVNPSGREALYTMPLDGSEPPKLLFAPPTPDDQYLQPSWSPDGKWIYFTHVNFTVPPIMENQHYPVYEVYRLAYPDGQQEKVADQALWPRPSNDGNRLVLVSLNPLDGSSKLFIANADGTGLAQVPLTGAAATDIIDAPLFAADDQSILFSAFTPAPASAPRWWERLLGITVASAHAVPSDWWAVPLTGGVPQQLTHLSAVGLYGNLSPDKLRLVSSGYNVLFVMNPDGTNSDLILNDLGGIPTIVRWIP